MISISYQLILQVLHFDPSTELEVEVVVHSDGIVWNKANGIAHLIDTIGDSLDTGKVLICGDTHSDLPMVIHVKSKNEKVILSTNSLNINIFKGTDGLVCHLKKQSTRKGGGNSWRSSAVLFCFFTRCHSCGSKF